MVADQKKTLHFQSSFRDQWKLINIGKACYHLPLYHRQKKGGIKITETQFNFNQVKSLVVTATKHIS